MFGVVLCLGIVCVLGVESAFPSWVHVCPRNSEVSNCVKDNMEKARPYLKKGIPKLFVPPLDPLVIPRIDLEVGQLTLTLFNYTARNADDIVVRDIKVNFEDQLYVEGDLLWVALAITANYNLKGQFFLIQLNNSGLGYGNMTNVDYKFNFTGVEEKINGRNMFKMGNLNVEMRYEGETHVILDELFTNRPEITKTVNELIEENMPQLREDFKSTIEKVIAAYVENLFLKLFEKYSLDELFPLEV